MQSCYYKKYLGVECLGCGIQRSFLMLLEGDFVGSFKMYPPLFLLLITFLFFVLHLIFRFKKGWIVLKYLGVIAGGFMIFSYIYKVFV